METKHPFVEHKVFIRTVTFHYTGRVVDVTNDEIVLTDAAWIADDGRFANLLADGPVSDKVEIEPYPDGLEVRIGRGSVIDWCRWPHDLPRKQK